MLSKDDLAGLTAWLLFDGWTLDDLAEFEILRAWKVEAKRKRWFTLYEDSLGEFPPQGRELAIVQKYLFHKKCQERYSLR
jgi:hypothetical protein